MYTMSGRIRYSETDRSGKLPVPGILDYFQYCSVFQSEELGLGVKYLAERHRAWVLNSWQLEIVRLPVECEAVTVETWASGFDKFHGTRNFTMKDQDGKFWLMPILSGFIWILKQGGRQSRQKKKFRNIMQRLLLRWNISQGRSARQKSGKSGNRFG